jgi:alpha-galactosidase
MDQTAYTLNSVTFGWWQTYLYDYIDADHLVFTGESHDTNIARFLSGVVAGPLILGDDFSKTAEWQKEMEPILQNREILSIVKNGKSFRPLLVIKDNKSSNLYFKKDGKNLYLVAFNFKPEVANIAFDLKEIGLTGNFKMKDLISQVEKSSNSELNIGFESAGAKVFRLLKE